MKFRLLLFVFVILSNYVYTQNIELVLLDGSQIKGYTEYNSWSNKTSKIKVKINDQWTEYNKSNIKEINFNQLRYIRKTVEINQQNQNLQSITDVVSLKTEQKEVFLKVLVRGEINLYSYSNDREHFFVSKNEGDIVELIYLKRPNKAPYVKYIGQLNILFSDCQNPPDTKNLKFKESSIKEAVLAYNRCRGKESIYVNNHKINFNSSFFLIGGYKLSTYNITSSDFFSNFEITPDSNSNYNFGIGLETGLSPNSGKLKLYNELLFQQNSYEGFFSEEPSFVQVINHFLEVDLTYLELNNFIRYDFNSDFRKFSFFINGGVTHNFLISDNVRQFANNTFLENTTTVEFTTYEERIRSYIVSASIGIGFKYDYARAEIRYSFNSSLTNPPTTTNLNNVSILFSVSPF